MVVATCFVVLSLTLSLIFYSLKRNSYLKTSCCLIHSQSVKKNKESSTYFIKNYNREGGNILKHFYYYF